MTLAELKSEIYNEIENIQDEDQLEALRTIIENYVTHAGEPLLSDEQLRRLEISRKQAENKEYLSNDEVDNEIDKWLEK
jgi:hypothetical protein